MENKTALSSSEERIDAGDAVRAEKPVKRKHKFRREWLWCWIVVSFPIIGYDGNLACVDVHGYSAQPNFDDEVE